MNGVMNAREGLEYPADLYLEGSDQYRGWFNSSLITFSLLLTDMLLIKLCFLKVSSFDGKR